MPETLIEGSQSPLVSGLVARFGPGVPWQPEPGEPTTAWALEQIGLVWAPAAWQESHLRAIWRGRCAGWARPVVVLAPSRDSGKARVLGPQDPQAPVRELPVEPLLRLSGACLSK